VPMAGLGSLGGSLVPVFDARYARGCERAPDEEAGCEPLPSASLDAPIPSDNRGYQLLAKQGWSAGRGLGAKEQGRTEPVRGVEDGLRLGLGRREEETRFTAPELVTRQLLACEAQACESDAERERRLAKAALQKAVAAHTALVREDYYCALCEKGYRTQPEHDIHMSSYDHHHRKRLQELREDSRQGRDNVLRREAKLEAREHARLAAAYAASEKAEEEEAQTPSSVPVVPQMPPAHAAPRLAFALAAKGKAPGRPRPAVSSACGLEAPEETEEVQDPRMRQAG